MVVKVLEYSLDILRGFMTSVCKYLPSHVSTEIESPKLELAKLALTSSALGATSFTIEN